MAVPAALLLLADSRLPAGAHAHSGGLWPAVDAGSVHDEASLEAFVRGRLLTAGRVAAAAAAVAARAVTGPDAVAALPRPDAVVALDRLDAELDARTPAPASRDASRAQGRGLLRAAGAAWPSPLLALPGSRPHAPVALGVVAVAAGCTAGEAATVAALWSVTGPASAAVRLLGLDPLGVAALLARLSPEVDAVASAATGDAVLPACSAPLLDHLAQSVARADVRLFAS